MLKRLSLTEGQIPVTARHSPQVRNLFRWSEISLDEHLRALVDIHRMEEEIRRVESLKAVLSCSIVAGDLLHVRLLGQNFIVLNSEKTARALLDQRSALYSDRPVIVAHSMYTMSFLPCQCQADWVNTRFGMDFSTVMLPYGDEWRLKILQHAFRAESEARNREVYLKRVRTLFVNLLDAPEEFELHIKRPEIFFTLPDSLS